jgi:transposase
MAAYNFSQDELDNLCNYRDKQNNSRLKTRFIALVMLAMGSEPAFAASVVGKKIITINKWLKQYIFKGIDSLNSFNYKPKRSYLNFNQINQTVIYVTFENPHNLKEIREYIKERYGIEYSIEAVRIMIKNHGLKTLYPKTHPGNPPAVEQQKKFIKDYNKQKVDDPPGSVRFFIDAMHLHHQNVPGRCWGDPNFRPVMNTNTGRKRLNILGAYNPETHNFLHLTGEENCNADRVAEFFEMIGRKCSDAPKITLYSDNAKYFYAKKVNGWLADNPKITLINLPPYAPNLNLIERFWKYTKDILIRNKYYKEYKMFRAKTFQFLNHIGDHIDKLKKLMVEKFEIVYV